MEALQYTIIKNETQYWAYCQRLESLVFRAPGDADYTDEIELLTLLIEKWDAEQNPRPQPDPIPLLKRFMAEHRLNATALSKLLGISKSVVSDILNLKRGLSKEVIRKLASHFKLSQEAFNRPYPLQVELNSHLRNAKVMNTKKELAA